MLSKLENPEVVHDVSLKMHFKNDTILGRKMADKNIQKIFS